MSSSMNRAFKGSNDAPASRTAGDANGKPPRVEGDLTPIVGSNLRRLRLKRGLSLERLAKASGVSRAMLGQIELGQSTPTINVVWKIARALAVPFSTLLTESQFAKASGRELEGASTNRRLTGHVVGSGPYHPECAELEESSFR